MELINEISEIPTSVFYAAIPVFNKEMGVLATVLYAFYYDYRLDTCRSTKFYFIVYLRMNPI